MGETLPRWPWRAPTGGSLVLDVAARMELRAVAQVRFARGTARKSLWGAIEHRDIDWASCSLHPGVRTRNHDRRLRPKRWMGRSDGPDPHGITSEPWLNQRVSIESEMALFSERRLMCAQNTLDIADIVREGIYRQ